MTTVYLDVTRWTGRAVELDDADSAPSGAPRATRASIAIYDGAKLSVFNSIRREAAAILDQYGVKTVFGHIIGSETILATVVSELERCRKAWDKALDELVLSYPAECEAWRTAHPAQADYIMVRQPAPDVIRSHFAFEWYVYDTTARNTAAVRAMDALPASAMESLRKRLETLYRMAFKDKETPSHKAWYALNRILQTAEAYSWLSSEAHEWAGKLETTLTKRDGANACRVMEALLGIAPAPAQAPDVLLTEARRILAAPKTTAPDWDSYL